MLLAFTITAVAQLRSQESHKSELISQLLFGETAVVIDETKDFFKVQCSFDKYEGWVHKNQVTIIHQDVLHNVPFYYTQFDTSIVKINGKSLVVPFGSCLYVTPSGKLVLNDIYNIEFEFGNNTSNTVLPPMLLPETMASFTKAYQNTPYLWGGKSALGIDCSALVQQFFKLIHISLPRDAKDQAMLGESIGFLQEAKPFDVAFFDDAEGNIVHTGILLNTQTILHAYGSVREDNIDVAGIVHKDNKQRTHQLRCIKRFITNTR